MNRNKKTKVISYKTIESKYRSGSAQPRRKVNVEVKHRNNKNILHVERNHSFDVELQLLCQVLIHPLQCISVDAVKIFVK